MDKENLTELQQLLKSLSYSKAVDFLFALEDSPKSFTEIEELVKAPAKVINDNRVRLWKAGLIRPVIDEEKYSTRAKYELTPLGQRILTKLKEIKNILAKSK
ncbi:hypothetical protein DRP05_01020 [Archaeoglobales archaeon]|nr:MAG: hypothetical protein DRP05_01020 [Archaeoglobales archaeon]